MKRWILIVTGAEALGFAVAAGIAISVALTGAPTPVAFALTVAGGALEGTALGTGQWLAMGGRRPAPARWIGASAAFVAVAVGAVVLLAAIPVLQWLALARPGTGRWVPVNMIAWAVAVLWTAAPSPLIDEHSPVGLVAVLYVAAGLLMAATIALLTARTAVRLFPAPPALAHEARAAVRAAGD